MQLSFLYHSLGFLVFVSFIIIMSALLSNVESIYYGISRVLFIILSTFCTIFYIAVPMTNTAKTTYTKMDRMSDYSLVQETDSTYYLLRHPISKHITYPIEKHWYNTLNNGEANAFLGTEYNTYGMVINYFVKLKEGT